MGFPEQKRLMRARAVPMHPLQIWGVDLSKCNFVCFYEVYGNCLYRTDTCRGYGCLSIQPYKCFMCQLRDCPTYREMERQVKLSEKGGVAHE